MSGANSSKLDLSRIKKSYLLFLLVASIFLVLGGSAQESEIQGPEGDYGDAPDGSPANFANVNPELEGSYPSVLVDPNQQDYIVHLSPLDRVYLGLFVTEEMNAKVTDLDDFDDSWNNGSLGTCAYNELDLFITVPEDATAGPIYLNILFDWDHNGLWADFSTCATDTRGFVQAPEWAVRNLELSNAPYLLSPGFAGTVTLPVFVSGPVQGEIWGRFTVSTEPVDESVFLPVESGGAGWNGSGNFAFGETEDYATCMVDDPDLQGLMVGCPLGLGGLFPLDPPPDTSGVLTVIKEVVNDNGGTEESDNFTIVVSGTEVNQPSFQGNEDGTDVRLNAGTYAVNEIENPGYTATFSDDCVGVILTGEEKVCTITNDDIAPRLTIITLFSNNDGGSASPGDILLDILGDTFTESNFPGSENGVVITLSAGEFEVVQSALAGYSVSKSGACSGEIEVGEEAVCTIVYDDIEPTLTLNTNITNDNGGSASPSSYTYTITGSGVPGGSTTVAGSSGGTTVPLNSGDFTVTVSGPNGYTETLSGECTGSIALGEDLVCTLDVDDKPPTFTLNVIVENDGDGTSSPEDFTFTVSGSSVGGSTNATGGSSVDVPVEAGGHAVSLNSAPADGGYVVEFDSACFGTLTLAEDVVCTITLTDNNPPEAVDDDTTINEDSGPVNIFVLTNDDDPNGDTLIIDSFSQPPNGEGTVTCSTFCIYTPPDDFFGTTTFTYTISDGRGGTDTATVTVEVLAVNDPPIAKDDLFDIDEDNDLTGSNLLNDNGNGPDEDVDGVSLEITQVNGSPGNVGSPITLPEGTLTIQSNGDVTFTPNDDFNGTVTFTYEVCDNGSPEHCDTATVIIDVGLVNDRPQAVDDNYSLNEDDILNRSSVLGVLSNDIDVDGDGLTVTKINGSSANVGNTIRLSDGDLTVNGDGSFRYDPDPNFNGVETFTYEVCDDGIPQLCDEGLVTITVNPINDPPVALNDEYTTAEDTDLSVPGGTGVLFNDTDIDSASLSVSEVNGQPSNVGSSISISGGTLQIQPNGSFEFDPDDDFNGTTTFTYKATDGSLESNEATVTINVTPVNDTPVAKDDAYSTNEDTPVTISAPGVLTNDDDIDGDSLTVDGSSVSGLTCPAGVLDCGSVAVNPNGSLTYTPSQDFSGDVTFSYEATDGSANSNSATVTITVNEVNDPPEAQNDSYSTDEDTLLTVNAASGVLDNDDDVDGDTLIVSAINGVPANLGTPISITGGTLTVISNGSIVFDPDDDFNGPTTFGYSVSDGRGGTDTASVTINVNPVNDPPVAKDDTTTVPEGGAKVINLASNDSDVDDGLDLSSIQIVGNPTNGTILSINGDGTVTYQHDGSETTSDSFTYTIQDNSGVTSNTATVFLSISPVNDPPAATNNSYNSSEDTPVGGNVVSDDSGFDKDSDPDLDTLTVVQINGVPFSGSTVASLSFGNLTINSAGAFLYEPNDNEHGTETFSYTITDGNGEFATATVSIIVSSQNDPPVAQDDSYDTDEDTPLTISAPGILGNDSDVDLDSLSATNVSSLTCPNGVTDCGSISVNPDGSFTYSPSGDFNGEVSFTYTANDGSADSDDPATVTITVNPVNDDPVAEDDTGNISEGGSTNVVVLSNDDDPDGDTVDVTMIDGQTVNPGETVNVEDGTATLENDGTITYNHDGSEPPDGGEITFTYEISDGNGGTDTATVTIDVEQVNDPPTAVDNHYDTSEDTQLGGNVIDDDTNEGLDSDPEGSSLSVVSHGTFATTLGGSVTLNSDGSFTYDPPTNVSGLDTFEYSVTDGSLNSNTATVTIDVGSVNDAPDAQDDTSNVNEGSSTNVDVQDNDSDPDLDTLTVEQIDGQPASVGVPINVEDGTATLESNGTITYQHNGGQPPTDGDITFTYTINDGNGETDTATVTIDISNVNDDPIAKDDSYSTPEETQLTVPAGTGILSNDSDVDLDDLDVTNVSALSCSATPNCGALNLTSETGAFIYVPPANFNGDVTFTYTANDGTTDSNTATVTITVTPVNDRPVARNDSYNSPEDTQLVVPVGTGILSNDSDVDLDDLDVTNVSALSCSEANCGVLNLDTEDGSFSYDPPADFNGDVTFTYTANDGTTNSNTATVTITVDPVNDPPIAADDSYSTYEEIQLTVPVGTGILSNDSDVDGDDLDVTNVSALSCSATPNCGTLNLTSETGAFIYGPPANFNGDVTFTYTANDGTTDSNTATVTITVNPVNDAPDAQNDSYTTPEDTTLTVSLPVDGILNNDSDIDGDDLDVANLSTLSCSTSPSCGTLNVNNEFGTLTYSPPADFNGDVTFTYQATDSVLNSNTATVTITVGPVNDPPVANPDFATTDEDSSVSVDVLANDTDVDSDDNPANFSLDSITLNSVTGLSGSGTGSISIVSNELLFDPGSDFQELDFGDTATVVVNYTMSDDSGVSASSTATITVNGLNDAPVANPDLASTDEETPINVDVLANDTDVDGDDNPANFSLDSISLNSVTGPAGIGNGTISIVGNELRFDPGTDFQIMKVGETATVVVNYTMSDDSGATSSSTATITVNGLNDPPQAIQNIYTTPEDTPFSANAITDTEGGFGIDFDIDGDSLSILSPGVINTAQGGTANMGSDGTFTYTPPLNLTAQDNFNYTISDGKGGTSTAAVQINFIEANDPPIAVDDSGSTDENTPINGNVLNGTFGSSAADSDPDFDPINVSTTGSITTAQGATVLMDANGNFTYDPTSSATLDALNTGDAPVIDTFSYTITDGLLNDTATVSISVSGVNDPPVADNDGGNVNEGGSVDVNVPGNDTDVDGTIDPTTVVIVDQPDHGNVSVNPATGVVTYTHDGIDPVTTVDTFTYSIKDNDGSTSNTATVTISITEINDPPVANDDSDGADEGGSTNTSVLGNDTDPENDTPFTVTQIDGQNVSIGSKINVDEGTATLESDGTITYQHDGTEPTGDISYSYTIQDNRGGSDAGGVSTATVTISITEVNDPPVANNDSASVAEGGTVTTLTGGSATVLNNDTDSENDTPFTVSEVNGSGANVGNSISLSHGTLKLNSDGTFSYTHDGSENFSPEVVTYTIEDNRGGSDAGGVSTGTFTINSTEVNDPPVANDDTASVAEGGTVTTLGSSAATVLDNDTDVENDTPLTVISVNGSGANVGNALTLSHGSLILNTDGTFSYTHDGSENFSPEVVTYTIQDNRGGSAAGSQATLTITSTEVNDSPVAVNDSYSTPEDTQLLVQTTDLDDLLDNDTDDDGAFPLSVTNVSSLSCVPNPGSCGTLNENGDGSFSYDPPADYNGIVTFTYTANDGTADSNVATVTITVTAVNDAPVAINNNYGTDEDIELNGNVITDDTGELGGVDSDPEDDAIQVVSPGTYPTSQGGEVILSLDGSFAYTPFANFAGIDTFNYIITDGNLNSNTATVTIDVGAVNDPPLALDNSYTTDEDSVVGGNIVTQNTGEGVDSDPDFDPLAVTNDGMFTTSLGATVVLSDDGTFTYDPTTSSTLNALSIGNSIDDTFEYAITDSNGGSDSATVTITVSGVNDPPVANDDSKSTEEDSSVDVDVTANDTDVDGTIDTTSVTITDDADNGSTSVNGFTGVVTYTPDPDFNGTDTFTYQVCDNDGGCDTAVVTITVDANPDAVNDSYAGEEDTTLTTGNVLTNDDLGDTPTTITSFDLASANGGTVSSNGNGMFDYTPTADFNGTDSFTYTITDNDGDTSTATVTITVDANPDAVDDSYASEEDTTLTTGNVMTNDDLGDAPTTITSFDTASANGGTVSNNGNGTFDYTPAADFNGIDTFTYTITDNDGDSDTATVTINVDKGPDAVNDSYSGEEDTTLTTGNVLTNDDLGDPPTTITSFDVVSTNGGTVSSNGNGTFDYMPVADFNGVDTFTYTITDNDGDTSTATVTINVDKGPDAVDDAYSTEEDAVVTTGNVLTNDDLGDEPTTITSFDSTSANGGTVSNNGNGTFDYTPAADFNGADTFNYTITDTDGDTSTATVTINVDANPDAVDDGYSTDEDTAVTTGNVLTNDDLGDEPTTITSFDATSANGGTVSNNGDGTFDYTPITNFNGSDTFKYTITDSDGDSSTATVTITVDPVNDPPVALPNSYSTSEDTKIELSAGYNVILDETGQGVDSDVDADILEVSGFDAVSANGASVNVFPDGTFTYDPPLNFNGTDTFDYTITDNNGGSDFATVTITVGGVNDPPVANDDNASTEEDTAVNINVTANDTDVDGTIDSTTVTITDDVDNGTTSVNAGTGVVTYTPDPDFNGVDTFVYEVCDDEGLCDTATVTITVDANPDAVGDSYATEEDTTVTTGNVLSNDDLGDEPTTITGYDSTSAQGGTVSNNGNGTFDYTPSADFNGTDTFTYTITDADGDTDTATVTITVDAGPDAVDDSANTEEDTAVNGDVSTNDDEGNTPATYTVGTNPTNGTLTSFNIDGTFTYSPNANFNGVDTFTYTITDADGDTDTATVTITVDAGPDAFDDAVSTEEDTAVNGDVSTNDDEGDTPATYSVNTGPSNGTLTSFNNDGTFTYLPNANFNGSDSFTYTITDADGDTDSATVVIMVDAGPDAVDDAVSTEEDMSVNGDVSTNDDEGDTPATYTVLANPSDGTLTSFNNDGTFTYTPDANFNGVDTFTYTITDSDGDTDTATVTITVDAGPDAVDDSENTEEDTAVSGDVSTNDDEGDTPAAYAVNTGPSSGTLTAFNSDGTFTYQPNTDFNGVDTFTYTVTDVDGDSDTATVTITVDAGPDAVNDNLNTEEDTAVNGDVSTNDDEGDTPATYAVNTGPTSGTLTSFNGDGTFTYEPNADFNGVDTFTYTITDADGDTDTATVTITVDAGPDAVDDSETTDEDTSVNGDVSTNDDEGDTPATYTVNIGPSFGTLTAFNNDGTFTYTPNTNFNGTDNFTYTITDADGDTDTAIVTITVNDVNDPPVANDDSETTDEDIPVDVNVPSNDTDVDGTIDTASVTITDSADNGSTSINPTSGVVTYSPDLNFNGIDTFEYQICDDDGACDTATVTIDVGGVNDPPIANDDSAATEEDIAVDVDVTNNDTDVDGTIDSTTVSVTDDADNGNTSVNPTTGVVTYTPDPDFNGVDTFVYQVCDNEGACDTATVTITVDAGPDAVDDAVSTEEDSPANGDVSTNDDEGDTPATYAVNTGPSNGILLSFNNDGTFAYSPNANFNGVDTFTYTITDVDGDTDTATVTITVDAGPDAVDDAVSTEEDMAVSGDVSTNDDEGDTPATYTVLTNPSSGTLTSFNSDGTFTYTPNANFNGVDTFTYTVTDADGDTDTATVTITVDAGPDAVDDAASTEEDTAVNGDVSTNDDEGDLPATYAVNTGPSDGTLLAFNSDGTFTYSPDLNFNGVDTFTYTITDVDGDTDTATVTITVDAGPDAVDDAVSTEEDMAVNGDVSTNDDEGDTPATYTVLTNPLNGTLTSFNADGTFTYNPNANFNGVDTFTYTVADVDGDTDTATVTITVDAGPDAVDDGVSTEEDTAVNGDVSTNDDEGDTPATYTVLANPSSGTLTSFNGDGTFTYQPNTDFNGIDTFTYTVTDADGDTDTATVTITVDAGPDAVNDNLNTEEDTAVNGDVSTNDDEGDTPATYAVNTGPSSGTLTAFNNDGTFTYQPNADFNGVDTFTYTITDADGDTDTATVTITVDADPDAVDDSETTNEDTPVSGDVSSNDDEGDTPATYAVNTGPSSGTLTAFNSDGTFTYSPNANFNGVDTFTYTVTDADGDTDTATVTITVNDVNDPPIANDDSETTDEDMPVDVNVPSNDTDVDGTIDTTSVTITNPADNGSTSVNLISGVVTYSPDLNFNGIDTFEYQICDDDGACDTATVTIDVGGVNDPPIANDDSASTEEDTAVDVNVPSNDTDVDGTIDTTSVSVTDNADNGNTSVNTTTGVVTYTPNPDFNGVDTFVYQVCDNEGACDTATVTITVDAGPDAVDDNFNTEEDTPVNGDVSTNDDEGDTPATYAVNSGPTNGTLTSFNNDGTFTYSPNANFNGVDGFTYTITDADGDTDTATVTITVDAGPDAVNDNLNTEEDTAVNGDVSTNDDEGDTPATYAVNTGPSDGTLTSFNNDGTFTYQPNTDFNGVDTFTYTVTDADGDTDTATVTITVDAGPDAVDDGFNTEEDTSVNGDVSTNDDEGDTPATYAVNTGPSNGTLTSFNNDGTFTYQPNTDFNGVDTFTYTITDADGDSDTATVTITVDAGPDAVDDGFNTEEDTSVNGDVSTNDDEGDTPATYTLLTSPSNGSLSSFNTDGTFTYQPNANFNGVDTFTYTITDIDGDTDTATVTITVDAGPDAVDDAVSTEEDTAVNGDVSTNDDEGDTPATYTVLTNPSNGSLTSFNSDGTFTYEPSANFSGVDTFTYTITDADGDTDTATVTITVDANPDAQDDAVSTDEDTPVNGDVSTNDDEGDSPASYAVNAGPSNGTLTSFNSDGTFTYEPNTNFNGVDTFTYTITDADGDTDTATVTITVADVNDPPIANNDSESTSEDTPVDVNVPSNDTDVDGTIDTTSVVILDDADNGTTDVNAVTGVVTYTANPNFFGIDTFTYRICDNDGACDTALVTITVGDVNDPPIANNDSATTEEDTSVNIDVPSNDTDIDGTIDRTTVAIIDAADNGNTFVDPVTGVVTYTPDPDFNGVDTFTYQVCDDDGACDSALVTITVDANPDAVDDSVTTEEDTAVNGDVSTNDDEGDTPATYVKLTDPSNGSVTSFNTNGTFTYQPNADFSGSDSFTYLITDIDGDVDTATVFITVDANPDAVDDAFSTEEDTPITTTSVLTNDDLGDTPTTITSFDSTSANGGAVVNNGNGTFDYTPATDFSGTDTFTYTITDVDGDSSTATVTITVDANPDAVDDAYSTDEDTPVTTGNVLTNDDLGDTPTTITAFDATSANGGSVVNNGNGTFDYTPAANFDGSDTFTYTITDADGDSDTATVTITVNEVNDPPDALNNNYGTNEDSSVGGNVITNNTGEGVDSDVENDTPFTVTNAGVFTTVKGATVNLQADGTFTYNPTTSSTLNMLKGSEQTTDTFDYTIQDSRGGSDAGSTATVTITIDGVNDGPSAVDNNYTTNEDTSVGGNVITDDTSEGIDSDVDGDTLTVSAFDATSTQGGIVSVNPDGTFTYTPAPNFNGTDTFTYTITDSNGGFDTATVTLTVNSVDDFPTAVDDSVAVAEDTTNNTISVLVNDDFGGDGPNSGAISLTTLPTNGTASVNNGGTPTDPTDDTILYTPTANYFGPDSLQYTITDADGDTSTATVTISVSNVEGLPVANDDSATTDEDVAINIAVLGNDTFGDDGPGTFLITTPAGSGTAVINDNGTPGDITDDTVDYTPNAEFSGTDSFQYTITDSTGDSSTATVTITVLIDDVTAGISKVVEFQTEYFVADSIFYTVTLTNQSVNTAYNVTVLDVLPAEVSFDSSSETHGSYNSGTGIWNVGTLPGSAIATLTLNVTIGDALNLTVTNTSTITNCETNSGDACTLSPATDSASFIVTGFCTGSASWNPGWSPKNTNHNGAGTVVIDYEMGNEGGSFIRNAIMGFTCSGSSCDAITSLTITPTSAPNNVVIQPYGDVLNQSRTIMNPFASGADFELHTDDQGPSTDMFYVFSFTTDSSFTSASIRAQITINECKPSDKQFSVLKIN
jgi:hypothetical protein